MWLHAYGRVAAQFILSYVIAHGKIAAQYSAIMIAHEQIAAQLLSYVVTYGHSYSIMQW